MLAEALEKFRKKPSKATAIPLHRLICQRRDNLKKEYDTATQCLDALKDYFCKETTNFRNKYEGGKDVTKGR